MFTSFDEEAFFQAISDKNLRRLKVNTVSTMLNDPTFESGETTKVLNILKKQIPEIFEDEKKLEYEERLDKSKWDKCYFTKLTYWFQRNFAESRIAYIQEVGKAVHQDTAKAHKEYTGVYYKPKQSCSNNSQNMPKKPTSEKQQDSLDKSSNFPLAGTIIAAVVLAGIVVLLIKLL